MTMESTATNRVWHKGPPPHVGWWNTSRQKRVLDVWRWWDGKHWSALARDFFSSELAAERSRYRELPGKVFWCDYYPADARVPRIDPAVGYVDHGDFHWYLFEGAPVRRPRLVDSRAWMRWAEQRGAQAAEIREREAKILAPNAPQIPASDWWKLPVPASMALAQLAMDAEKLAERLRKLSNEASSYLPHRKEPSTTHTFSTCYTDRSAIR